MSAAVGQIRKYKEFIQEDGARAIRGRFELPPFLKQFEP
jgi:hypothetical protein